MDLIWNIQFDAAVEFGAYKVTDEGYLLVKGTAAAEGPMVYENAADGSKVTDFVPAEVLEAAAPMLKNTPVTLEHPPGLLDSKTVRAYQVGEVVDSAYNPETRANDVDLLIRDHDAVQAVLSRKVLGLSPGYRVRREPANGAHGADRIQVERIYNHLALTRMPRRGEATSVRLDSAGNAIFEEPEPETRMDPEENDSQPTPEPVDPNAMLLGAIQALGAKIDALSEAQALPAPEEPETDSAPADDFLVRVAEYNRTVAVANRMKVEFDPAVDSTEAIQRKIVGSVNPDAVEGASADYLRGMMAVLDSDVAPKSNPLEAVEDSFGFGRSAKRKPDEFKPVDPTRLEMSRGRKPHNGGLIDG